MTLVVCSRSRVRLTDDYSVNVGESIFPGIERTAARTLSGAD